MKSFEELYNEVLASEELQAEAAKAGREGRQQEFLKAHGCDATPEEVSAFLKAKEQGELPLTDDELKMMNGGFWSELFKGFAIGAASGAGAGAVVGLAGGPGCSAVGAVLGSIIGGISGAVAGGGSSQCEN